MAGLGKRREEETRSIDDSSSTNIVPEREKSCRDEIDFAISILAVHMINFKVLGRERKNFRIVGADTRERSSISFSRDGESIRREEKS